MNQVELDLTYRLDELKAMCNQYGWESEMCKTSVQLWLDQHKMNLMIEKYSDYLEIGFIIILFIVLIFLIGNWANYSMDVKKSRK